MHVESGLVDGTRVSLSCGTATAVAVYATKLAVDALKNDGPAAVLMRALTCIGLAAATAIRRLQGGPLVNQHVYNAA